MLGFLTRLMEEGAVTLRRWRVQRARRRMLAAVREYVVVEGDLWNPWRLATR